jgi:TolA-binding protein
LRFTKSIFLFAALLVQSFSQSSCSFLTYTSVSKNPSNDSIATEPEPNYNVTLDFDYQDFTSYLFIGNRVENFTAYFNTFYRSNEDYEDAYNEYRASLISYYNRRLDSLGIRVPVSASVKEKLDKSIERASKIIQFYKFSKFIDDAVLIIGKAYFMEGDYYKAERTFNEFLSKFSSSTLADEAILYLGRTKIKLGKIDNGESLFKNLVNNSTDHEIQSLAARELGIVDYNKGKYADAVKYFQTSIDYSDDNEKKAETQFILAKILSGYQPPRAAKEYKKVLNYTSDYDLSFYSKLNYAKGLIYNKDYANATEVLTDLRKKYRDEPAFTQLVDLQIANNLYQQKKYKEANDKYYEVIVKYPNTAVSSDAYYFLAKDEEEVKNNYLNALVNYKKAVEESNASDYYRESSEKSITLERYFTLLGEVGDSTSIQIPTANADVERFRKSYNEEKGIDQPNESGKNGSIQNGENNNVDPNKIPNDGSQKGDGKGKPGGFNNNYFKILQDSTKEEPVNSPAGPIDPNKGVNEKRQENYNKRKKEKEMQDSMKAIHQDSTSEVNKDSLEAVEQARQIEEKENKIFNSYYEIAEIFIYSLDRNDSAEHYLKLLLSKFPESDKQAKVLYTLGNFYKNTNRKTDADVVFNKIISVYPNTIFANESKRILGIKTNNPNDSDEVMNPVDNIFKKALNLFNEKKYPEAIGELQEVVAKYPKDTMVAKALYSIGWIYENMLSNKDSSLAYYKKLKEAFPESPYTQQVTQLLDYFASLEVPPDSTKNNSAVSDSVNNVAKESPKEENKQEEVASEKKEGNTGEVKSDTTNANGENKLSQDEIDKLLKEGDESGK